MFDGGSNIWAAIALCLLLQVAVYAPFLSAVLHTTPLTGAD
jgi:hypothetical protein